MGKDALFSSPSEGMTVETLLMLCSLALGGLIFLPAFLDVLRVQRSKRQRARR